MKQYIIKKWLITICTGFCIVGFGQTVLAIDPPPVAPTGVIATPGDNNIYLSWLPTPTATSYTVLKSTTSGGPYTAIPEATNIVNLYFTDTLALNNNTYYYVVTASNAFGTSPYSLEVSAKAGIPPENITDLRGTADNQTVTLTWTTPAANSQPITDYLVKYYTSLDPAWQTYTHAPFTSNSITINNLSNFITYTFDIQAVSSIGIASSANWISLTPTNCGAIIETSETCTRFTLGEAEFPFMIDSIPSLLSFNFPSKGTSSTVQQSFSNDNPSTPQVDVTTTPEDILTILDLRGHDQFDVTITADQITDGINSIPLHNLYVLTSYPDLNDFDAPLNRPELRGIQAGGLEYAAGSYGATDIIIPAFAGLNSLSLASTYTAQGKSFDADSNGTPDIITLMNSPTARSGLFSLALNFYLEIPASQPAGQYQIRFTIDLISKSID